MVQGQFILARLQKMSVMSSIYIVVQVKIIKTNLVLFRDT